VAIEADDETALKLITQHFDVTEKEEIFYFKYESEDISTGKPVVEFSVVGASRHRGQTLASSGDMFFIQPCYFFYSICLQGSRSGGLLSISQSICISIQNL
jgi:hypothetical protein